MDNCTMPRVTCAVVAPFATTTRRSHAGQDLTLPDLPFLLYIYLAALIYCPLRFHGLDNFGPATCHTTFTCLPYTMLLAYALAHMSCPVSSPVSHLLSHFSYLSLLRQWRRRRISQWKDLPLKEKGQASRQHDKNSRAA